MSRAKPQFVNAHLNQLHPTQITVGKAEVALKRKEWSELGKKARSSALADHWFPSIMGPEGRHYIVDHHHFGLALLEEEVKTVSLMVLKDLSWLLPANFWHVMDHHQWVHPYDADGRRRDFDTVPKHLTQLQDDPYRSLAGELRRAGGFSKDVTPFSEFLWADFFRSRIDSERLAQDFTKSLAKAMKLARSQEARYLPGWSGVIAAS
ncbi:MAG: chromosome partitioning protein ParB [Glaciimonas sp.]|nr:chromosome partitioning protein ParB [Glaciimonas sp.]